MEKPERKGEIKGHTCACITPEEKLKKTVTKKGTNLIMINLKNTRQYDVENLELIKHLSHTFESLIIGLIYPT